eukprot:m.50021 g.50021  ORF g.50021 m.50021 type:complete len:236 (-) comp10642_c0_seq8:1878-2585(-)
MPKRRKVAWGGARNKQCPKCTEWIPARAKSHKECGWSVSKAPIEKESAMLCAEPDCMRAVKSKGFCFLHGGGTCKEKGCVKGARRLGFCHRHYLKYSSSISSQETAEKSSTNGSKENLVKTKPPVFVVEDDNISVGKGSGWILRRRTIEKFLQEGTTQNMALSRECVECFNELTKTIIGNVISVAIVKQKLADKQMKKRKLTQTPGDRKGSRYYGDKIVVEKEFLEQAVTFHTLW